MVLDEFLAEWHNDSDRVLVHTSGSTGKPKPLMVEKRRMEASARITCSFLGLRPGDTALLCMSLDYIAGKMMVVRSLVGGLRLICVKPSGHPLAKDACGSLYEAVTDGLSFAAMVPMQVYNSLQVPVERELLMRIRHLIIGGGAIDDRMAEELRTFPNAVWSTYGMTETLSHIALRRLSGPEASEWYTPFNTVGVSIGDDGCLVIDAPAVCGNILVTNDRAEIAGDGRRFRIIGRKDNVICSGGMKIQPEEVERVLKPHLPYPFLITRRKDAKFGEAVVLLVQSAGTDYAKDICRRILPRYQQPKHYISVAAIPMTMNGKPERSEAERLANIFEEQIHLSML